MTTLVDMLKAEISRLEQENAELRNEAAKGVHTCHANCPRPMCVLTRENEALKDRLDTLQAQYSDLLMQVVNKIPGESRHETAKRIIRQHEIPKDSPAQEVGGAE